MHRVVRLILWVLLNAQVVILTDVSSDVTIAYDKVYDYSAGRDLYRATPTVTQDTCLARCPKQAPIVIIVPTPMILKYIT